MWYFDEFIRKTNPSDRHFCPRYLHQTDENCASFEDEQSYRTKNYVMMYAKLSEQISLATDGGG